MEIIYKPIGVFHCSQKQPATSPQQATHNQNAEGVIELHSGQQFEQALDSIDGFSHIWVLFHFHQNETWKPMVQPPRGSAQKRGVFATRSPYRPNGIGLSAVEIIKREGLNIFVRGHDLLDATPILDLKPYLSYADCFTNTKAGWTSDLEKQKFEINYSPQALQQLQFLENRGELQLRSSLISQLQFEPFNQKLKRVEQSPEGWIFAFRTWRVHFTEVAAQIIEIKNIFSGYSKAELNEPADPYFDKNLHKIFNQQFAN